MVGVWVADEGCLVDDGECVGLAEVVGEVAGEGGVGGEDDVAVPDGGSEGVAVVAVEGDDAAVGGEAFDFGEPVSEEGGGDDDEAGGVLGALLGGEEMIDASDGLKCLTEAHVIG